MQFLARTCKVGSAIGVDLPSGSSQSKEATQGVNET